MLQCTAVYMEGAGSLIGAVAGGVEGPGAGAGAGATPGTEASLAAQMHDVSHGEQSMNHRCSTLSQQLQLFQMYMH